MEKKYYDRLSMILIKYTYARSMHIDTFYDINTYTV